MKITFRFSYNLVYTYSKNIWKKKIIMPISNDFSTVSTAQPAVPTYIYSHIIHLCTVSTCIDLTARGRGSNVISQIGHLSLWVLFKRSLGKRHISDAHSAIAPWKCDTNVHITLPTYLIQVIRKKKYQNFLRRNIIGQLAYEVH